MQAPTTAVVRIDPAIAAGCGLAPLLGAAAAAWSPYPQAGLILGVLLLLGAGWVAMATFLTRMGSGALACELDNAPGDFPALTSFTVRVRLANANRHWPALFLTSRLQVRGNSGMDSPALACGELPARQVTELTWQVHARARGEHEIQSLRVVSRFPGSIVSSEQEFVFGHRLLALPAVYRLQDRATQLLVGRRQASGSLNASPSAIEEFVGVRPYRPGDNPRLIHLATSLRLPGYPMELAVREFEDPSDDDVCVVLDTGIGKDEKELATLLYRHEKSVSFSIALCRLLRVRKYRVRFRCVTAEGGSIDLRLQHPVRDLAQLNARLARLRPTEDRAAVWRLLESQADRAHGAVLYISLRETAEEKRRPRLAVVSVTPDWQISLVSAVGGV